MHAASATTGHTTTLSGTDPIGQFSSNTVATPLVALPSLDNNNTATSCSSSSPPSIHMSSPPHKPRFSRSPTPYSLEEFEEGKDKDNQRSRLQRSSSASATTESSASTGNNSSTHHGAKNSLNNSSNNSNNSATRNYTYIDNHNSNGIKESGQPQLPPSSSSSSSNTSTATTPSTVIPTTTTISNNNNNDNNDHRKPTAGWTLFAALAKMSPEEVELIRLTKANTAANKLISASLPAVTVEVSGSMGTDSSESAVPMLTSPTMDATLPNSSSPKRPSSPSSQHQREISLSPPSPPSSLSLSESLVSNTTSLDPKYGHHDTNNKCPDSRSSPSPLSTNDSERGSSLSPSSPTSSSSSLSSVPSSFQLSPSPDTSSHRKKRSKLSLGLPHSSPMPPSALCRSRKLKFTSSLSKSVQIDESKNMVFSYQSGSTIAAFLAAGGISSQDQSEHEQDEDYEDPVHKNDKTFSKNSFDATGSSSVSSSSPWWSWSSAAASSPSSSQSGSLNNKNKELSSLSPPLSWTPEASGGGEGGSLDSTLSNSGKGSHNNTFMNIASSLDRLWSPPLLRRTFSEVSSSSGSGSSGINRRGSKMSSGASGGREAGGVPRIPMLRRQASMPSMEREMSEENPFMEPPTWSPAPSQSQESRKKSPEVVVSSSPSTSQESTPTAEKNDCQEVVMTDVEPEPESQVNALQTPSTPVTPTLATTAATSKSSRGAIRRRDTRHSHHPYRRPSAPSTTDASQDASLLALPAQFRRAASFNGTTSTPVAQPVLRREASTTAYMDTL